VIRPVRPLSLRVWLTLCYVGAMLVVLGVYAAAVYAVVNRSLADSLDQRLRGDFWLTAAMVDKGADGSITWYDPEEGVVSEDSPWLQVWSPGGEVLYANNVAKRWPLAGSRELALRPDDRFASMVSDTMGYRVLSRHGKISGQPVVLQVGRSEAPTEAELRNLALILVLGLPLGVALAGLGGYFLASRALAPVNRMAERARLITAERLSERLPVNHPEDELGRLATVFNETLGRLEASFEQMRRFTADVSHELRTPLTAIRSVGEVGLREHRDEPAYRAIVGSMLEEVDRLSGLVDRLLTLSRAESGQAKLSIDVIDLHELAEDVVGYLGVLAEEKQQSLTVDCTGTPRGLGDRLVLRQSLINLVDNAIKYTPVGGRIRIQVAESPSGPSIVVSDTGPGIATDIRSRVFDRYYRAGRTPASDIGGSGLGLAIAKWAVEANGGRLSLEESHGSGSTFRMTLPRAPGARASDGRVGAASGARA
jgi:heavy metal sensor kinase